MAPLMLVAVAITAIYGLGEPSPSGTQIDRADADSLHTPVDVEHLRYPVDVPVSRVAGIHKIRHVIIVMQENHSFDNYFGTFPGADGFPRRDGRISVCVPDPHLGHCVRPFHDSRRPTGGGGLHNSAADAVSDIHGGRMDGFLRRSYLNGCPTCQLARPFAIGYRDSRDIPNYWTLARRYVLQDHMFEPSLGWSLPSHLFAVSAWSARCHTRQGRSCRSDLGYPSWSGPYSWTPLTHLLHRHHVSWGYYVQSGLSPDCPVQDPCKRVTQTPHRASIWNPLPRFTTTRADRQEGNIRRVATFFAQARAGKLPAVSWVIPNDSDSEHPPASIHAGQRWVTTIVDAVMRSSDWRSSAIFVTWDDWGGYYDHMPPPRIDRAGYGIRVPGLVISPYARTGYIDHQTLSFDAYLKFIEDDFLGGARLNPLTDGRPDTRPTVRENSLTLGDLALDFNFAQPPRPPQPLPLHPVPYPPPR